MSGRRDLPLTVDDLTPSWFSHALERDVTEAAVTESSSGTTGRARVALRGEPDLPATVFVKLPPADERQRALVEKTGMGVAEARFYRDLASEIPVRVPGVWFADTHDHGYVMVLEDLIARGCRFPTPDDADIAGRARNIVEQLATLHAAFWETTRFDSDGDLSWVAKRAIKPSRGGTTFIKQAVAAHGDTMDAPFHRIAELYLSRAEEIGQLWTQGPHTLVHGDPHMGNLFVDVAAHDRTGFFDWAVLTRATGMRDVAYVLCNSVPADVREANERRLVEHYCKLLAAGGVDLDPTDAWNQYRLFALYAWVAATATAGMGSKWQPLTTGLRATQRATAACAHLDTAGLIESLVA